MARHGTPSSPGFAFLGCLVVFVGCDPSHLGGNSGRHGNPSDASADGVEPDVQRVIGGPCLGNPDAALYASYVNMRIRTHRVWKGALPNAPKHVHVEHPWPNNEPTEALARAAPRGVRVIAFARLVENARELAKPLEEDGIARPEDVAANLLNSPPYGLIFESVDAAPILPRMRNETLDEVLVRNPDDLSTFDAVLEAISSELP